jgi:DNA-binding transcriptional LysR family regulator
MSYFDNLRTFVRIYELGSMSAAARDQRISPAVTSARISQLESHLGVRLFQRTTRSLTPTEQGRIFYDGACAVLEAVEAAEAGVGDATENPRGTLHIAAPLGVGRRLIAPHVPEFTREFPLVDVRLRMTDRKIDLTAEGLDIAFFLGRPEDSNLRIRKIADCDRVLCAAPSYIAKHGHPKTGAEIDRGKHNCLNLRFPGAREFQCSHRLGLARRWHRFAPRLRDRRLFDLWRIGHCLRRHPTLACANGVFIYPPPPPGPQSAFVYGVYD